MLSKTDANIKVYKIISQNYHFNVSNLFITLKSILPLNHVCLNLNQIFITSRIR